METKRIKSKKEKAIRKLDIVFVFLCVIWLREFIGSFLKIIFECIKVYGSNFFACLGVILALLWSYAILLIIKCHLPVAIYLAFRITVMKVIKENNKYEVINNIVYYRERFNNITPAEISLITDLEIEVKKDISATLLDLYQKGIIDFQENSVIVKNEEKITRKSEEQLIKMIKNNNFSDESLESWKNYCIIEAKENNYIKEKVNKVKGVDFSKNNKVVITSIKLFFIAVILGTIFLSSPAGEKVLISMEELERKDSGNESYLTMENFQNDEEAMNLFMEFIYNSLPLFMIGTILFTTIFILLATPIYRFVRRKIYNKVKVNYKFERTKESKILVEQIAGIKNYIHDFSLLSEKDKEHVMLWEDFLIYAILLEENEIIIKDICKYKNINLNNFNNIKKLFI